MCVMTRTGRGVANSATNSHSPRRAIGPSSRWRYGTASPILNETANYAHVFLPGSTFLEKDGTFTNAERRINRVRQVKAPMQGKHEWEVVCDLAQAMGYDMHYDSSAAIMDEIAATLKGRV